MASPTTRQLADAAYLELSFQAVYAMRQGNVLTARPGAPSDELAVNARRLVAQSKFLVSFLIVLLVLGSMLTLTHVVERFFLAGPTIVPLPLYIATVIAGLLLLEMSFLWMVGLQSLPTYLSSQILPMLESLPIPEKQLDRVALLVVLRLFDAPALTALVLTPLALGIILHSVVLGLLIVPGVVCVVLFSIALSLRTGRFFVQRVQGSRGGFRSTVFRWAYLLLWAIPAFGIYGFVAFSFQILYGLTALAHTAPGSLGALLLAFPFPFGVLPVLGLSGPASLAHLPGLNLPAVLAVAAAYVLVAAAVVRWLRTAPRELTRISPEVDAYRQRVGAGLRPVPPPAAVLIKDVRTASRTPGYAFLILLPLIDAVVIGFSSYFGTPGPDSVFDLGAAAVSTTALLATFFGPAFFATEVMGFSYTRTLPLSHRSLLVGKASLIVVVYLLASAVVVGLTVLRILTPLLFLAFIVAELPGLVAAAFLEIGLLLRKAERTGVPISMLSSGAWWTTTVALPGIVIAGLPIILFLALRSTGVASALAFVAMGAFALVELALFSLLALVLPGRGRG